MNNNDRRLQCIGRGAAIGFALVVGGIAWFAAPARCCAQKPYRLPDLGEKLKEPIIWGSICEAPDGTALAFGGQDQTSEDGIGHTRLRVDGKWRDLHDELRKNNPLQAHRDSSWKLRCELKNIIASARHRYFEGLVRLDRTNRKLREHELLKTLLEKLTEVSVSLDDLTEPLDADQRGQRDQAKMHLQAALARLPRAVEEPLLRLPLIVGHLEEAAQWLDAEPAPRALSPLVFEPKNRVFVLFGGDHCDYLLNDVWSFDTARRRWRRLDLRSLRKRPAPRANHELVANGDGTVTVRGGYDYTSNTDYCGGQYRDLKDGSFTFDLSANAWTATGDLTIRRRRYREGPFDPDFFFIESEPNVPNREEITKKLAALPANVWTKMNPPRLPQLNRDWGTAILDPDRDLILRWSGGHSAHGGTDVLHYHLATNRWELCYPVEFPLGQLYSNTSYPDGWNFNRRPWVTGHTYQSYAYDPPSKRMLFVGRERHCYEYDPVLGDWDGRTLKPKQMVYDSCFYTLTTTSTPQGAVCWTQNGDVLRYDAKTKSWTPIKQSGEKLPGSIVDNSTVVYDARRDRLVFARKPYGDKPDFDGQLHALDLKTGAVTNLDPAGRPVAAAIPYLCQIRYDAQHDLMLVGGTLPPDTTGLRRTPAYDCGQNRWISLRITGDDPSGKTGRNVSLGLVYDAKRKLFWAVDTHSQVYVLLLDAASADLQPL